MAENRCPVCSFRLRSGSGAEGCPRCASDRQARLTERVTGYMRRSGIRVGRPSIPLGLNTKESR